MNKTKRLIAGLMLLLFCIAGFSQQLKLGNNPSVIEKAAVLELQSDNQGLLFPRITDTALINIFKPADGMVIFHVPSKKLMVRTGGYWLPLVATPANSFWFVGGNTNGGVNKIGNSDNYDLSIITNNLDRIRINAAGNIGIGNSAPAQKLDVSGNFRLTGAFMPGNNAGIPGYVLVSSGNNLSPTWQNAVSYLNTYSWVLGGNSVTENKVFGTISNFDIQFLTNNTEKMRLNRLGFLGVGVTNPRNFLEVAASGVNAHTSGLRLSNLGAALPGDATPTMLSVDSSGNVILVNSRQNIRLSGDATGSGTADVPVTLATVNKTPGVFGDAGNNATFEVNEKGLITSAFNTPVEFPVISVNGQRGSVDLTLSGLTDVSIKAAEKGQTLFYDGSHWISYVPPYLSSVDTSNIANFHGKVRSLFSAAAPITLNTAGQIVITKASDTNNGYLSGDDWTTFNSKLSTVDTGNIIGFGQKVRNLLKAGSGISYSAATGIITNTGVRTINGKTGTLTLDTTYISNFSRMVRPLFSAGAGITYNSLTGQISTTVNPVSLWTLNGNTVQTIRSLGTIDNIDLPFITGNTERMRINSLGNVGIGTSTPNAGAKLDVSGSIKLGASGTVQKNVISFEMINGEPYKIAGASLSATSLLPGQLDIYAGIPDKSNFTSSTRASVSVSFDQDLPAGVVLASARMFDTGRVLIRFLNNGTDTQLLPDGLTMYVSVIEF